MRSNARARAPGEFIAGASIRLNLLKWLIVPLLIINLVGAGLVYWLAWKPAQTAFDQSLADTAWALVPRLKMSGDRVEVDLSKQAEQVLRVDHVDAVYFSVRNEDGAIIAGDADFPPIIEPPTLNLPSAYDGRMRKEPIRITTLKTTIGTRSVFISVGETLRKRHQTRSEILLAVLCLQGLFAFFSTGIIWFGVTKGLLPLNKMQADLDARKPEDLSPVEERDVSVELIPVVRAINRLLDMARTNTTARQDFLADVAHQLRTPLAGLKTQLEWLQQAHASESATVHSVTLMMSSTERMIRQTNQLLTLARAESGQFESSRLEPLELNKLVEESVQHFVEAAVKKNIDLGFDLHVARIIGDRFLLRDLIDNLIDNAVRYSPDEGTVTVSCSQSAGHAVLSVEDSGPGIPAAEKEKIFDRFYRIDDKIAGSGLGLAIVRDIATVHGAEITVVSGTEAGGTVVSVRFLSSGSAER